MRKILLICFSFCCVTSLTAQYPGYKLLVDTKTFQDQFAAASQQTKAIRSDFIQEKNLSMISEKIVSKGKFCFQKENKVRMEYTQPFQYLMVINDKKVFIKDGQKENTISTASSKLFQQITRIILECVRGTALSNPDFKTRVFENSQSFLIEMSPVSKGLREFFKTINITIDKKDYLVNRIEMNEQHGDNTLIRFINQELNQELDDALFTIR